MAREPESQLARKSQDELKQLAWDIYGGAVFTDRHLGRPEDITMVFMVLGMMERKQLLQLQRKDRPGMFYEYLSAAGPRSINGMPMFFSVQLLHPEDTKIVWEIYRELESAEKHLS